MDFFFAQREDDHNISSKVYFRDIYYIETIKSTHYCKIVHAKGINKIYSDITPLAYKLGGPFVRCRSSTIVNINQVIEIDRENRLLYFENGNYCDYSRECWPTLKKLMSVGTIGCRNATEHEFSCPEGTEPLRDT